ncbi:hypothetical protein [Paenibacillus protaetiae]|uniref:Uncharacterized protein n=1 Tax=Paenibacillus protaetiae TaxID=2509456 RepID=A0A4P6ETN2_9BACL|nr:hypothetical protein [Paenibacillus protaetiae]QAY66550.1 hypothetical protein ET464_09200 [Paenibacillus protaetiae]
MKLQIRFLAIYFILFLAYGLFNHFIDQSWVRTAAGFVVLFIALYSLSRKFTMFRMLSKEIPLWVGIFILIMTPVAYLIILTAFKIVA